MHFVREVYLSIISNKLYFYSSTFRKYCNILEFIQPEPIPLCCKSNKLLDRLFRSAHILFTSSVSTCVSKTKNRFERGAFWSKYTQQLSSQYTIIYYTTKNMNLGEKVLFIYLVHGAVTKRQCPLEGCV